MAKSTTATSWEIVTRDEEGATVNIDFNCPYCKMSTGVFILVGASGLSALDGSWETDQTCPICNKSVVVQCY